MKPAILMNLPSQAKTPPTALKERKTLSAVFFNREGEPETQRAPASAPILSVDSLPFTTRAGPRPMAKANRLSLEVAMNRLRRALFETGQLCVTTKDGLSRVCFAGIGDPERLFVEAVPRDVPVPSMEFGFPGCLCSLAKAESILREVYRGERSDELAETLNSLALGRRKRRIDVEPAHRLSAA